MHPGHDGSDPTGLQAEATEVNLTRIDVGFLDLTWFFVKASLALAAAFSVTSWLWVLIGTTMLTLSAGLLVLLGVPDWFAPPPVDVIPAPVPLRLEAPVSADPEPEVEPEVEPVVEVGEPILDDTDNEVVDPHRNATEAAQRAELERVRRARDD